MCHKEQDHRLGLVLGLVLSLENMERKTQNYPHISTLLSKDINVTCHGITLAFVWHALSSMTDTVRPIYASLIVHICPIIMLLWQ